MIKQGNEGTEIEISAASQMFEINIFTVNSNGKSYDMPFRYDKDHTAPYYYIYNDNNSHYRNLWEVSPPHEDNFENASQLEEARIAMKPMSELIVESSLGATVSSAADTAAVVAPVEEVAAPAVDSAAAAAPAVDTAAAAAAPAAH
jgi:hypothetical protein